MAEANRIDVIFGAQIGGLIAGVQQVEAAVKGLTAPVQEFQESLGGIGEALSAAFAVEKIKEFIVEMGEAGERALNMSAAVGLSVEKYTLLTTEIALAGGNAESAGRTLERLGRNISEAVANPASRAAQGFQSLRIGMDTLRTHGNDLSFMLELLAKRFIEYQNSTQKTADFIAVTGRGFDQLAGFFREAGINLEELKNKAESTGAVMDAELAAGLANSGQQTNVLSRSLVGLSYSAFGPMKFNIDATVGSLTRMVQQMSQSIREGGLLRDTLVAISAEFRGLSIIVETVTAAITAGFTMAEGVIQSAWEMVKGFANAIASIPRALPTWMGGGGGGLGAVTGPLFEGGIRAGGAIKKAAEDASTILDKTFDGLQKDVVDAAAALAVVPAKLPGEGGVPPPPMAGRGGRGGGKAEYEAYAAEMRLEIAEADKDWAQISAIYDKWAAHAKELFGNQSKEYREVLLDMTRAQQQHLRELFQQAEQNYSATRSIDASYLKQFEANMEEMVKKHQISRQQMYGFDIQYAQQRYEIERKILEDMITNLKAGSNEAIKVYQQLMELDAQQAARTAEYRQKGTQQLDFSSLTGGIGGAVGGVIRGQETAGQALAKMGQDILQKVMDNVIQKLIVQTITNLLQQLASDAANTGILAALLTLIFTKPQVAGTTFQFGGIVPSAAGGWVIPSFQSGGTLAQLHSGEMVLPKDLSEGVQSAIRGGGGLGGGTAITVNAWDTQTGAQALMRNSKDVANAMRSGWMSGGTSMRAMSSGGRYP